MALTATEKTSIINAVLSALETNTRNIAQLTLAATIGESDYFEIAGGKKVPWILMRTLMKGELSQDMQEYGKRITAVEDKVNDTKEDVSKLRGEMGYYAYVSIVEDSGIWSIDDFDFADIEAYALKGEQWQGALLMDINGEPYCASVGMVPDGASSVTISPILVVRRGRYYILTLTADLDGGIKNVKVDVTDLDKRVEDVAKDLKDVKDSIGEVGGIAKLDAQGYIPERNISPLVLPFIGIVQNPATQSVGIMPMVTDNVVYCNGRGKFLIARSTSNSFGQKITTYYETCSTLDQYQDSEGVYPTKLFAKSGVLYYHDGSELVAVTPETMTANEAEEMANGINDK